MASHPYNDGVLKLLDGSIQWTTDTIRARAISAAVTPNKDDTSMTGYTDVGGSDKTLVNCTRTKDNALDRIVFDANDMTAWTLPTAGPTAGGVVIFKFVVNDASSIPIFHLDATNLVLNGTDLTAPFPATGVYYLQQ